MNNEHNWLRNILLAIAGWTTIMPIIVLTVLKLPLVQGLALSLAPLFMLTMSIIGLYLYAIKGAKK